MKNEILNNLDQPKNLEALYLADKSGFKTAFNSLYPSINENCTAQVWYERLNYTASTSAYGNKQNTLLLLLAIFVAGLIAKIPDIANITQDLFYARNIGFIIFPLLAAYFAWKQKMAINQMLIVAISYLASALYMNLIPYDSNSNTFVLACLHLPFLLWALVGYTYTARDKGQSLIGINFLKFNGDLTIISAIIMAAGMLFTAICFGLFELINIKMEPIFTGYLAVWGIPAVPLIGTYILQNNPHLVSKISPIIAKLFTPLVLITLIVYLSAIVITGKDPYNDREFLIIFNVLLIGVMALILFSVSENSKNEIGRVAKVLLLGLSSVTIIINAIALSAILFRISSWGITPNRVAVLGANILMLGNLGTISFSLFNSIRQNLDLEKVKKSITSYLPIYIIWIVVVVFLMPLLFDFK